MRLARGEESVEWELLVVVRLETLPHAHVGHDHLHGLHVQGELRPVQLEEQELAPQDSGTTQDWVS